MPKTVRFQRLLRDIFKVSVITAITRVLGFAREFFVAALIGIGPIADTLALALRTQILFRQGLIERAVPITFVPSLVAAREKGEAREFRRHASGEMTSLALIIGIVLIIGAPLIVWLLAPGFWGDPQRLGPGLMLVMAVGAVIPLYMIGGLVLAFLQAEKKFVDANLSLIIIHIVIVAAILMTAFVLNSGLIEEYGAAAILAGGLIGAAGGQLLLGAFFARRHHIYERPRWGSIRSGLGLFKRIAPISLVALSLTAPILIATRFVSSEPGAIATLFYAERFVLIAPYILGFAFANVMLPNLSELMASGAVAEARRLLLKACAMAIGIGAIISIGIIFLSAPVLQLIFSHTQLGPEGTEAVWRTLIWLSPLVPIRFCLQPVLQYIFIRKALKIAYVASFGGALLTIVTFLLIRDFMPGLLETAALSVVLGQAFQIILPLLWIIFGQQLVENGQQEVLMEKGV